MHYRKEKPMENERQRVALVTGASRGIGREIAMQLASKDYLVIVNYSGSKEAAEQVVAEIKAMGRCAVSYGCDVADFEQVKEMIDYIVTEYQRIDVIVNNAGITRDNLILKMSEDEFDAVLAINLKGAFNTAKHATRYMIKQRSGRIINISSVVGITGNAGQVNYSAAKAGLIGMTKTLARELAARNITVNAVAPGFIRTDMTEKLPPLVVEQVQKEIPLKRFGTTKDVADMVTFLATNEGNYITGQVFQIDGGLAI